MFSLLPLAFCLLPETVQQFLKTLCKGDKMLKNLSVQNFALIENAELEFGEGLNILTGESGEK